MVELPLKGQQVYGPPSSHVPILLVEDCRDDAELIAIALRRSGMAFSMARVETEPDFAEALNAAPEVILCDFRLPRLGCEAVLRCVAHRSPGTPVIVLARHLDEEEAARAMRLGAAAVLSKGRLAELAGHITASLRHAGKSAAPDRDPPAA